MPDVGDTITLSNLTTSAGAPADVAGLTVSVTQPDGTAAAGSPFTPTHNGAAGSGSYSQLFPIVQAGRHLVSWQGTGYEDGYVFNAWPKDRRLLFPLEEGKRHLRRTANATLASSDDEDLLLFIAAATYVIEDITGPLIRTQVTDTFDGGGSAVLLPSSCSAVAVTENGVAITDVTLDGKAGILYAGGQQTPRSFLPGRQNITVTYTVGDLAPSPNLVLAAREAFRFLWQTSQQGDRPDWQGEEDLDETPSGFTTLKRVIELCGGHPRMAGFA